MAASTVPRPRLITHKRALIPTPHVPKVVNPSALPAETRLNQHQLKDAHQTPPNNKDSDAPRDPDEDLDPPLRTELSFAIPPQPFLDPPTWDTMLKRGVHADQTQSADSEGGTRSREEEGGAKEESNRDVGSGSKIRESADQRRRRREREAEYRSMAIRGRSSIRGRGRARTRGGYWGGQY